MLKSTLVTTLGLAALCSVTAPALAQEAECHQSGNYFIIGQERATDVGTDFIIKRLKPGAPTPQCAMVATADDLQLNDPNEPFWFEGLAGKYLVLTRSTGPDGSVVIFDLDRRTTVVDTPADDDVTIADQTITFWQRIGDGTTKDCPEMAENTANGMGTVIAVEIVLDTTKGEAFHTGKQHCSSTQ